MRKYLIILLFLVYSAVNSQVVYYYDYSNTNYCVKAPCMYIPVAPTATAGTSVAITSFSANWYGLCATGYYLDVSTSSGFGSFVTGFNNLSVGNVTTYSVTGLTVSTTYYYRVRASNSFGTSGNSNVETVTTTFPSLPVGYVFYIKSDSLITKDGSNNVTAWGDCSGNGYNLTAHNNPVWVASQINGYPAIQFNGSNSYLIKTGMPTFSQPNTIIAVWNITGSNSQSDQCLIADNNNYGNQINYSVSWNTSNSILAMAGGAVYNTYYTKTIPFSYITTSVIYNTSNSYLYENGSLKINASLGSESITNGICIGGDNGSGDNRFYVKGNLIALIIYHSALSTANRQAVELYFRTKYAHY